MFVNRRFSEFFKKCEHVRDVSFLVLHHIEARDPDHAIEQLREHEVSSHFIIDEDGKIYELVAENNIAYHAGVSFWRGIDGLNKSSIGIEFISKDAFKEGFKAQQMQAGVELCRYLMDKHKISAENLVGHSDIGYDKETGLLDRKQDPSHLFDWKYLGQNNIGIYPDIDVKDDEVIFKLGCQDENISQIKQLLSEFGYRISNLNGVFDQEMLLLVRVFNRRFNQSKFQENSDFWYKSSQQILNCLIHEIKQS